MKWFGLYVLAVCALLTFLVMEWRFITWVFG